MNKVLKVNAQGGGRRPAEADPIIVTEDHSPITATWRREAPLLAHFISCQQLPNNCELRA
jgi:hypothetical protein